MLIGTEMSDSEDESPEKQLKIALMGDGASGKVLVIVGVLRADRTVT